ncbi:MAG TPA: reverse transcriptase/maturase family protein, partial [Leptospiraceae bacterium]|nr:reverse transcriptase/maturase family protein [Leptospiraceae bacterium]HNH57637.1 reverse transcriptase/maturase family protein [Leptospiraceae bacterium]
MISSPSNFFSVENLHKAYLKCRKGKRGKIHTRGFEIELYQRLNELSLSLQKQSYKPSRSVCFYVSKPKLREIFAADFGDRVVHRLLIDLIEPYYEKKFITDSFACRKEKGTHRAVLRLKEFIRIGTNHSKKPLYYLQLDIKGFFMEIDKRILCSIIEPEIDQTLQWLCKTIICHNPTKKFIYRGKVVKKGILPPHKTLFHEDENKGIPIGNLTSQFFANVYLNELDQFIKRGLGIKYYIRYVDDFLILHENPEKLMHWKEKIIQYLYQKLKLTLKDDVMPLSVYKGIDFLRIPRVLSRFSRFRFQIR